MTQMQRIQKRYQNVHLKKKKFFKPIFLNIIFYYVFQVLLEWRGAFTEFSSKEEEEERYFI